MIRHIAIIDLGSNSIRMNVIGIDECGGYCVFDQASEMVRLSEGLLEDLYLKKAPMDRTLEALKYFQKMIEIYKVEKVYALATAAVRMAHNGKAFLKRVEIELGLKFSILTGIEEAYYDYLGVVNSIDIKDALIIDIGGGSTELILMRNRKLMHSVSLPFGSVTLSEQFKMGKKRLQAAEDFILETFESIDWLDEAKELPIIGLGGVIRMIAKMDRAIENHSISNLHNYKLSKFELERVVKLIADTSIEELPKLPGMSKRRADISHMGIMPLWIAYKRLKSSELRISGNGLREGYFYSVFLPESQETAVVNDVLEHSRTNMMRRFSVNETHAQHIRNLAMDLMSGLDKVLISTPTDRLILENAAYLHDVGMHIEYYNHHVHGFYLILNGRLDGLSNLERISVAYLVGSHRENGVKSSMDDYSSLIDKKELIRLDKLSMVLMLAEQLDRSETQKINRLHVNVLEDAVIIFVESSANATFEIESALRLGDKFEKVMGRKLNIEYFA